VDSDLRKKSVSVDILSAKRRPKKKKLGNVDYSTVLIGFNKED
jgi:hypothetical protein